jgi:RNA polymerase sigma-70 factor, ECF subfamily
MPDAPKLSAAKTPPDRTRLDTPTTPDELYERIAADYGIALERLARGYEPDPERRRDLLQEIHIAVWRSLARFGGRCSIRTWVYRVAHNTATSHTWRRRANGPRLVSLDDLESAIAPDRERVMDDQRATERLVALIHRLKPLDRQLMLLYLEDLDAVSIGEIVGLSPGNVATKLHRIRKILTQQFREGGLHGE